jgi:hypothetical protein
VVEVAAAVQVPLKRLRVARNHDRSAHQLAVRLLVAVAPGGARLRSLCRRLAHQPANGPFELHIGARTRLLELVGADFDEVRELAQRRVSE